MRTCRYIETQRSEYRNIWHLQQNIVAARRDGRMDTDVLILVEHPPVFTMGRRGGFDHLTVPEAFLKTRGIDLIQIERGGDITYHGPGQWVGYPIVDLQACKLSVVEFVNGLEEIMIRTAAAFDVSAQVDDRNRGVWVGDCKLGSVGIAVRRSVTFHGFALNVNTDLTPFGWINPCGLEDVGVTSLAAESGRSLSMASVRSELLKNTQALFGYQMEPINLSQLQQQLNRGALD